MLRGIESTEDGRMRYFILDRVIREGLTEKKIFEQRLEKDKAARCVGICRENIPESTNSWYKIPEVGVSMVCCKNSQKVSLV